MTRQNDRQTAEYLCDAVMRQMDGESLDRRDSMRLFMCSLIEVQLLRAAMAGRHDIRDVGKPAFIYHLGDHDPSGVDAGRNIERRLREFAPDAEIHFERLAVNPDQIAEWSLPTRPTKAKDSRSKKFGPQSCELDAIEPNQLRGLVETAIRRHTDPDADRIRRIKVDESREREALRRWASTFTGDAA